jgi:stage II sporulation protein M
MRKDSQSGFFIGLYKRNETFLLLSAVILLGSMVIGYIFSGVLDPILGGVFEGFRKSVTEGTLQLTTLSIFVNNFKVAIVIYLTGLTLGIVSAYFLFFQGIFTGYVASKYYLPNFLFYTIPHGIFEVTAIIIAGAAGFRLASVFLNFLKGISKMNDRIPIKSQLGYLLEANAGEFKDSLKLFIIAVVILFIAAIIEANFTIPFGNYIRSIT